MTQRLSDVDVTAVHMVDSPANKRKWAIVKNLLGRKPTREDTTVDAQSLITKIEKGEEFTKDQLLEVLKRSLPKDPPVTPHPEPDKTLAPISKETKETLPDAVVAHIEALEAVTKGLAEKVTSLVMVNEDREKSALQKRAEALQAHGFLTDVDLAKDSVTEDQVTATEKAAGNVEELLKSLGVFHPKGSAAPADDQDSATAQVTKEVVRRLGHEPHNAVEEAQVKKDIYDDYPGLLSAVRKEERHAAAAAE